MKINVIVPVGELAEMHEIELPDDQLLKLGKKYFELASNPVTSTYVNEQPDLEDDATIPTTLVGDHPVNGRTYIATYDVNTGIPVRYSYEDLIHMAQVMKTFCSSCEECEGCPFWDEKDHCRVYDTPNTWKM